MNFLSHYYFERHSTHPERVLGGLLPDLLKNVDKTYNFHPQRYEDVLLADAQTARISEGWYQHVEIDRIFHGLPFFLDHCYVLRKKLVPVLEGLPIRPSFMAHIAIELLLDHLLIAHNMVNPARLYDYLEQANTIVVKKYLHALGLENTDKFFAFFKEFINSRYVLEYADIKSIPYALFQICKRIWSFEVAEPQCRALEAVLTDYAANDLKDFRQVFQAIADELG